MFLCYQSMPSNFQRRNKMRRELKKPYLKNNSAGPRLFFNLLHNHKLLNREFCIRIILYVRIISRISVMYYHFKEKARFWDTLVLGNTVTRLILNYSFICVMHQSTIEKKNLKYRKYEWMNGWSCPVFRGFRKLL